MEIKMRKKNKIAPVGAIFSTGQKAPVSGIYEYLRHVKDTTCYVTMEERYSSQPKNAVLPPHRFCKRDVVWRLLLYF